MRKKNVDPVAFDWLLEDLHLETPSGPLPSPCIGICQVNTKTKFCEGCFRTVDEIAEWGAVDEARKRTIWLALKQRRHAAGCR